MFDLLLVLVTGRFLTPLPGKLGDAGHSACFREDSKAIFSVNSPYISAGAIEVLITPGFLFLNSGQLSVLQSPV